MNDPKCSRKSFCVLVGSFSFFFFTKKAFFFVLFRTETGFVELMMLFLEILPGGFIISESSRGKERVLFQFDQFMEEIVILLFFFCVCVSFSRPTASVAIRKEKPKQKDDDVTKAGKRFPRCSKTWMFQKCEDICLKKKAKKKRTGRDTALTLLIFFQWKSSIKMAVTVQNFGKINNQIR